MWRRLSGGLFTAALLCTLSAIDSDDLVLILALHKLDIDKL